LPGTRLTTPSKTPPLLHRPYYGRTPLLRRSGFRIMNRPAGPPVCARGGVRMMRVAPSSRGPGRGPLKAETGVRIPLGPPSGPADTYFVTTIGTDRHVWQKRAGTWYEVRRDQLRNQTITAPRPLASSDQNQVCARCIPYGGGPRCRWSGARSGVGGALRPSLKEVKSRC
jgi:hypothetical protein